MNEQTHEGANARTEKRTNERTNEQNHERNKRTNKCTNARTNPRTNRKTHERANEGTNLRTNLKRGNKPTNERTNTRANKQTNERTSEQIQTDRSEETATNVSLKSVAITCETLVLHPVQIQRNQLIHVCFTGSRVHITYFTFTIFSKGRIALVNVVSDRLCKYRIALH